MAKKQYTKKYKRHLLNLVREGRTPKQLAQEYEPFAQTIRNWLSADEAKCQSHKRCRYQDFRRVYVHEGASGRTFNLDDG